jgi:hypothetical protein
MPLVPVPKFIEMETKIVGPLVFRQVVFIAVTLGICFLLMKIAPHFFSYFIAAGVLGFGLALAFLKIEGIPFNEILAGGIGFLFSPRKFVWGAKKGEATYAFKEIEVKKLKKDYLRVKREGFLEKVIIKVKTKK